jgi:6,7-dimethyl-8-ribityllumazine synthase
MREMEGALDGTGLRVCVVVARWNGFVTKKLLEGAVSALRENGLRDEDVGVAWVPGAFEVPTAAKWAAESQRFDAVVCLGAVIRGETAHFEYVAGGAAEGIAAVARETGVPVIFGVLTVDSAEQALARCGGKEGHKGEEAARAAIEMANLRKLLS